MKFPKVNWITDGKGWSDYRPAIKSDGKTILFERKNDTQSKMLYKLVIDSGQDPAKFLPNLNGVQTRPDWCWEKDVIAFNVSGGGTDSIYTVGSDGKHPAHVHNTDNFVYPQWDTPGKTLTVMNSTKHDQPCTSVIKVDGTMVHANVNGSDSSKQPLFGGMPAVRPGHADQIAFAGQPNWYTKYDQQKNYIFLNNPSGAPYTSNPMEPGAPLESFDDLFQGRAPAWSPDGRYIVFESNRTQLGYALFLFDTNTGAAPVQLTDPTANEAQHAKWYPDGWCLIFSAKPPAHPENWAIAYIVIADYLS